MRSFFALVLPAIFAACAAPPAERWTKSGAGDAATTADMSECRDIAQQHVERDAGPGGVQLAPLGHAMDVFSDGLMGQSLKLFPSPASWLVDLANNREVPPIERGVPSAW